MLDVVYVMKKLFKNMFLTLYLVAMLTGVVLVGLGAWRLIEGCP